MKNVLITGGAGDIARAIKDKLESTGDYHVDNPSKEELDVSNMASVMAYLQNRNVDILINNAGFIEPSNIAESSLQTEQYSIAVNLLGVWYCTHAVLQKNQDAKILNIGSSAGSKPRASWSNYCAAKAAVIMATKCWAQEGIWAVCLSPGRTATKMRKQLFPNEDIDTLLSVEDFAQVVVHAINGAFELGSNIDVTRQNVHAILAQPTYTETPSVISQQMKSKTITIKTEKQFTPLNEIVNRFIQDEKGLGLVHVFVKHTTCAIKIIENEILLLSDIDQYLAKTFPKDANYSHDILSIRDVPINERVNGFSHMRQLMFSTSETIPCLNGKMNLGQWQTLFLIEFDPIREREVVITYTSDFMRGGGAELDLVARFAPSKRALSSKVASLSSAQRNHSTSYIIHNKSLTCIPKMHVATKPQNKSSICLVIPKFSIQNTSSLQRKTA